MRRSTKRTTERAGARTWIARSIGLLAAALLTVAWTTSRAEDGTGLPAKRYRATLVPIERTPIAAAVDGIVADYAVAEGQRVVAGATIATIDPAAARFERDIAAATLDAAKAKLHGCREELAALQTLLASESIRRIEVDRAASELARAEAEVRVATLRLERAEWHLDAHTLRARHDGVLVARRKLPGQGLRAFETVCELVSDQSLLAVVQIPVAELRGLEPGRPARFEAPSGVRYEVVCHSIGLEVNPGANAVRVEFVLRNEQLALRPGTPGDVLIGADE